MGKIEAIVSDFGGVLTSPLMDAFLAIQDGHGVALEQLGNAMRKIASQEGRHPLFELEKGRIPEAEFLNKLERALEAEHGRSFSLHGFRDSYFGALHANQAMIQLMRELKEAGYRMALLTNNVREWEPLWRAKLPVDEIFEVVIDSAFVDMRKPEPSIYRLVLERLGGIEAESCLFIDDVEVNCQGAEELGMQVVHFQTTEQAQERIQRALAA